MKRVYFFPNIVILEKGIKFRARSAHGNTFLSDCPPPPGPWQTCYFFNRWFAFMDLFLSLSEKLDSSLIKCLTYLQQVVHSSTPSNRRQIQDTSLCPRARDARPTSLLSLIFIYHFLRFLLDKGLGVYI